MKRGPQTAAADALHAMKYREEGETFVAAMGRIAHALADSGQHEHELREMLLDQRFVPAGRIQAAMGASKQVTAFNCSASLPISDSFVDGPGSIMDRAKEAATTMRMGCGIGYDFSPLRPRGDLISKLQSHASGPVSFMQIYNAVCLATSSSGHRRGAQMATLRCDHPSIEEFIAAKQNTDQLTGFNISVCLTDDFMEAVSADRPFDLRFNGRVYKTISAVDLWESLMRSTWDWAEPGVIFIDRVNHMNNLWYAETIHTTNPCSEVPLPPGGVCLLGSINLVKYITRQPSNIYAIDLARLEADIPAIISALDNVIDRSLYPLPEQRAEELSKRRIGLGVMGLANAIEATGPFYASPKFLVVESAILQTILYASYRASIDIAKKKGPFPLFDVDQYPRGNFVKTLPDDIRHHIARHGIRNSHLTSIAPTGTISQICDNISSGIEPVWSYSMERKINTPAGSEVVTLADYGMKNFNTHGRLAHDVTPAEHVQVLTEAQKWVDQSISKTVNCPSDMPWPAFKNVYLQAWEGGAKGCATFTDGGLRSGLLKKVVETDGPACRIDPETGMRSCD